MDKHILNTKNKLQKAVKNYKSKKKNKVIMMGSGPSLDNLNIDKLNTQNEYDTLAITDAIKMFHVSNSLTYVLNFHYEGLIRIKNNIQVAKHVLLPKTIVSFHISKKEARRVEVDWGEIKRLKERLDEFESRIYYFSPINLTKEDIEDGNFDTKFKDNILYQAQGSVVAAFYFLAACMGYKEIYFIGFDGSFESSKNSDFYYGEKAFHPRKPRKIPLAGISYKRSWDNLQLMRKKYFREVLFKPLNNKDLLKQ
jgi:hypothetical protein